MEGFGLFCIARSYFAAVTAMDRNIGRVIDKLEQKGLRGNTLICFLSDNGFICGHHGIWGKGNGTFPQNTFDTSVKVPAIFSQPGKIPEGNVACSLVSGYDFMPTLLEYLHLPMPENEELELSIRSARATNGRKGRCSRI